MCRLRTSIRVAPGVSVHRFVALAVDAARTSPMSLEVICEKAGVNRDMLRRWAVGKRGPSIITLEAVLDVLGYEIIVRRKVSPPCDQ
ncbi:helix-turn-helix domain-containing protein [Methylocystis heyeri]|uniref:helix-turn-helix domain-containing protein n=1 Tax=Methylocystis heyeri TaxID=391905 RepID=UPI003CCDDD3F